jgi:hypothetical protein
MDGNRDLTAQPQAQSPRDPHFFCESWSELVDNLPENMLALAHRSLVSALIEVRNEIARHTIAEGHSFVASNATGHLDRDRRLEGCRQAEQSICNFISVVSNGYNAVQVEDHRSQYEKLRVYLTELENYLADCKLAS